MKKYDIMGEAMKIANQAIPKDSLPRIRKVDCFILAKEIQSVVERHVRYLKEARLPIKAFKV